MVAEDRAESAGGEQKRARPGRRVCRAPKQILETRWGQFALDGPVSSRGNARPPTVAAAVAGVKADSLPPAGDDERHPLYMATRSCGRLGSCLPSPPQRVIPKVLFKL